MANLNIESTRPVDEMIPTLAGSALCGTRDYGAAITPTGACRPKINWDIFRTCLLLDFGNESRRSGI
jgi:hypothetical protein